MKTGEYNSGIMSSHIVYTVEKAYNTKHEMEDIYTDGGSHYVIFDEMEKSHWYQREKMYPRRRRKYLVLPS